MHGGKDVEVRDVRRDVGGGGERGGHTKFTGVLNIESDDLC